MLIHVNTIETKWDNRVTPAETTWEVFRALIVEGHQVSEDRSAVKLFNAAQYKPVEAITDVQGAVVYDAFRERTYTRRLAENVLAVSMLVLDYDGGLTIAAAKEGFREYEYVAYTSFGHLKDKRTERFRVVLPLIKPIPASGQFSDCDDLIDGDAWYELEDALREFAGPCDPVSFRCNQFYYLPVSAPSRLNNAEVWTNPGRLLDWTTWSRLAAQKYSIRTKSASLDRRSTDRSLGPNQLLRTHGGYIRVRDVTGRVEGVWCPFHDDKNGSEFLKRPSFSDNVFLYCRRCNKTYWMWQGEGERDSAIHELPLITMEPKSRLATFTDSSDRTHVNEQLAKIRQSIKKATLGGAKSSEAFPTHLVYLPEGTGKSGMAFDLAAEGQKILFACKSLTQVFEKYDWFLERSKRLNTIRANHREMWESLGMDEMPPKTAPVNVQLYLSKGAKARRQFGVNVVRHPATSPFDLGDIDDEASIHAFVEANPDLSEQHIRLAWQFFEPDRLIFGSTPYPVTNEEGEVEELIGGSEKFETADIIVTTFAMARILRARKQRLPTDWTVWFDDPGVDDFSDIEPFDPERWGELDEEEEDEKGVRTHNLSGQKYFFRQKSQSLGAAVRNHRCVYTTTEKVTLRAARKILKARDEEVVVHDKMEGVIGGKITILGTESVYSSYDGIIPLMARRLEKEDHEFDLITDGLGQGLNHTNTKGMNDLAKRDLVIEVSAPHPQNVLKICDMLHLDFKTDGKAITRDMVLDQLHQALGRNSGYRYAGRECVALVPANLHRTILRQVRYAYDVNNSVIIDRLAGMRRTDRRTKGTDSPLVLAIEEFLNNFDVYVQDKRKVLPDVTYVLEQIVDLAARVTYASRLLYALTNLSSGLRFDRPATDAERAYRYFEEYQSVVERIWESFKVESDRQRVVTLYQRRIGEEEKPSEGEETAESEET